VAKGDKGWLGVPWCALGILLCYRKSWFDEIGFSSRQVFEKWFVSQKGFSIPATRVWTNHPLWNEDPVMGPFKDVIRTARAPGWPGPSSKEAAEVVSKYIITDMYAKAVEGMPPEDAVKWAHDELVKIYSA
jgi:multiple sugar transport system substrate-binding protein